MLLSLIAVIKNSASLKFSKLQVCRAVLQNSSALPLWLEMRVRGRYGHLWKRQALIPVTKALRVKRGTEGLCAWEYEMPGKPAHNHQWGENGQITNLIQIMFIAGVSCKRHTPKLIISKWLLNSARWLSGSLFNPIPKCASFKVYDHAQKKKKNTVCSFPWSYTISIRDNTHFT